jgi:hypothetical protein
MQLETFSAQSLQQIIPAYLYQEYADDPSLQAFIDSYNSLAQGYLAWFNQTPLGVYISPYVTGPLLDWIGQGVYGISRPVLSTLAINRKASYNAIAYNELAYNGDRYSTSGNATIATDDIYKRVMTWNLYRGDGQMFTIGWLKNRVNRFLNGANGTDYPVLNNPPSISVSGNVFTIQATSSAMFVALQQLLANGALSFPFQYQVVVANYLSSNGGLLQVASAAGWPTNPVSLPAGSIWNDGGVAAVVPGITPNPAAPPVYFINISAAQLLVLGGGNLPLSNPGVGSGQLWNNGGAISIA